MNFIFQEKEYNILAEHKDSSERGEYEYKYSDIFRERTLFAYRPWWVGNKFRWLKTITIKENLQFTRRTEFDDGWSYQNYWLPWESEWEAVEIL